MNMKQSALTLLLFVLGAIGVQAQTIQKGNKFFDGEILFTVQEVRMGTIVYMVGEDAYGNTYEMTLKKNGSKPGEYTLQPSSQADDPPKFGIEFGWRVQYVRENGMNFLALRKPNGDARWIYVLTPDNLQDCLEQQKRLEDELPTDILCDALLNGPYVQKVPREELRLMRNEILARHGYRFQSKDLQEHFSHQPWYKPGRDNNAIRLNIIEQTNIQLIKSEEEMPGGLHPADVAGDVDQSDFED